MISEIILKTFGILLLIILIAIIIYFLALLFIVWSSQKEKFDDKFNYYMSDEYNKNRQTRITEEEARDKAEWHTR